MLHTFALFATFGSCVSVIHYLSNQFLLGDHDHLTLQVLWGLTGVCILGAFALMLAILASALQAQRDAMKRVQISWQPDNTLKLSAVDADRLPLHLHHLLNSSHRTITLPCQLAPDCYSSHWFVVLALRSLDADSTSTRPFHLVLARDALSGPSFRQLRLWIRARS